MSTASIGSNVIFNKIPKPIILIPSNSVVFRTGSQNIQIPILIQINAINHSSSVSIGRNFIYTKQLRSINLIFTLAFFSWLCLFISQKHINHLRNFTSSHLMFIINIKISPILRQNLNIRPVPNLIIRFCLISKTVNNDLRRLNINYRICRLISPIRISIYNPFLISNTNILSEPLPMIKICKNIIIKLTSINSLLIINRIYNNLSKLSSIHRNIRSVSPIRIPINDPFIFYIRNRVIILIVFIYIAKTSECGPHRCKKRQHHDEGKIFLEHGVYLVKKYALNITP